MPRIAQAEIDRVKREVPLTQLAAAAGVTLKGHGANLLGLCPFHADREPSLVIDPDKNLWNCLGACAAGGDSIQWVMKREGVGFQHAVEILRAMLGGETVALGAAKTAPKLPPPVAVTADAAEALRAVCLDYYPSRLVAGSAGWHYLEKRGVLEVSLLTRLKI
jgi:DNA primase